MNLNENTEFIEESFEKELEKRIRLSEEENIQNIFINFNEGNNVSYIAKEEL